tara:strand:+ start:691 stop:1389 length:699 start_codon:yes stop_codon:yes gene_type:complete
MNTIGIIPARLHSTRFPKKILYPIEGKPMVAHVYEQVKKVKSLDDVIVAIDSKETEEALKKLKIKYVMTSNDHISGTDRVQEAISKQDVEIVVNIQADEPSIDPGLIDMLINQFDDENIKMATIAGKDMDAKKLCDPNTVKVLLDRDRFAVNFRRNPIESEAGGYYHHMGIYAYRKAILDKFISLEPSENEIKFKLEQYRALDNKIPIKVVLTEKVNKGIDVMDDLKEVLKK